MLNYSVYIDQLVTFNDVEAFIPINEIQSISVFDANM